MAKRAKISFGIAAFGILQFVVVSAIIMLIYNGGDRFDPTALGYNFFGSYLSDLGRMHAFTGMPTYGTGIFYAAGLTTMGICTVIFFLNHKKLLPNANILVLNSATFFGVVAGLGYAGIAFTPWDMYADMHIAFVFTSFLSFMLTCFLFFYMISKEDSYPAIYGRIFLFFGVFIAAYVIFLIVGPSSNYKFGRMAQATGQKILFYSQSISMFFCCLGAFKLSTNAHTTS